VLTIPDRDQQLVLLTAAPGSPSERALHRLTPDRVPDCTLAINPVEERLVLNGVAPGEPTADCAVPQTHQSVLARGLRQIALRNHRHLPLTVTGRATLSLTGSGFVLPVDSAAPLSARFSPERMRSAVR
jgi:hypothetical protein